MIAITISVFGLFALSVYFLARQGMYWVGSGIAIYSVTFLATDLYETLARNYLSVSVLLTLMRLEHLASFLLAGCVLALSLRGRTASITKPKE